MPEVAGLLSIAGAAGALGWAVGVIAAAAGTQFLLGNSFAPGARCRRVEWLALLPLAGAMLAVAVLLLPALLKFAGFINDHCLAHGLHHPHFCLRHLPSIGAGPAVAALLLAGVFPAAGLVRVALARFREASLLDGIERMAYSRHAVIRAELDAPRAFVFGLRRPRIVLSTGLLRRLTTAERHAVVRHEIAHARAGDPARRFILGFLLALHFPQIRKRLLRQWNQAAEERADDRVAARGRGPDLARALVKILRRTKAHPEPAVQALSVGSADVARRVQRLVDDRHDVHSPPCFEWVLAIVILSIAVTAMSKHHLIETLAGLLVQG